MNVCLYMGIHVWGYTCTCVHVCLRLILGVFLMLRQGLLVEPGAVR